MATKCSRDLLAVMLALALALVATTASRAHHSFSAQYDAAKRITLRGLVTKVEWRNPHAYFYMDVDDGAGNISQWAFEMGAPSVLQRRGFTRNTLVIGTIVEVNGALARDGSQLVNATTLLFTDTGEMLSASDGPISGSSIPDIDVDGSNEDRDRDDDRSGSSTER